MYFSNMEIHFSEDGTLHLSSWYDDDLTDNELITRYFVNDEETKKLLTASGIQSAAPETELYALFGSSYGFEKYAIEHEIHFEWYEAWEYPVGAPAPKKGTDADCYARKYC